MEPYVIDTVQILRGPYEGAKDARGWVEPQEVAVVDGLFDWFVPRWWVASAEHHLGVRKRVHEFPDKINQSLWINAYLDVL